MIALNIPSKKVNIIVTPILKVKVLVAQSCLTLCNPMDCSPPGFSVLGISQARIVEWGALAFSRRSQPRDRTGILCVSCIGRQILYHRATWEAITYNIVVQTDNHKCEQYTSHLLVVFPGDWPAICV